MSITKYAGKIQAFPNKGKLNLPLMNHAEQSDTHRTREGWSSQWKIVKTEKSSSKRTKEI